MAKQKYVLVGPEAGAAGIIPVTKELVTYEGDALYIEGGFVVVQDSECQGLKAAVIRLAEGQSIKRKE
jgi:hypothetical protein